MRAQSSEGPHLWLGERSEHESSSTLASKPSLAPSKRFWPAWRASNASATLWRKVKSISSITRRTSGARAAHLLAPAQLACPSATRARKRRHRALDQISAGAAFSITRRSAPRRAFNCCSCAAWRGAALRNATKYKATQRNATKRASQSAQLNGEQPR